MLSDADDVQPGIEALGCQWTPVDLGEAHPLKR